MNAALIVAWVLLREIWFDGGSIGCDDSDPPQPPNCDRNGTILAYLAWAEVTLLVSTMLRIAARWATRRWHLRSNP